MIHSHPFIAVSPDRILDFIKVVTERSSDPPSAENFTLLPESLLLHPGTIPIFTIRNPKLAVPSAYRVMNSMGLAGGGGRGNYLISTCNIWSCMLYEYYISRGTTPIVAEANDFMTSEDFVRHLCVQAGLDSAEAYFSWPAEGKDNVHPSYYLSQSSLLDSTGPDPKYAAKNVDLNEEEKEWEAEFGSDLPLVKEMVELAMPYYEYLYERRLKT